MSDRQRPLASAGGRTSSYDSLWVCRVCGRHWVVPSLAAECASKH